MHVSCMFSDRARCQRAGRQRPASALLIIVVVDAKTRGLETRSERDSASGPRPIDDCAQYMIVQPGTPSRM